MAQGASSGLRRSGPRPRQQRRRHRPRRREVQNLADKQPDTALALPLDVTDDTQITAAVAAAEERFGGVDVLANNAGYGYRAAVDEGEDGPVRQLFDTHVFGSVRTIKAELPGMRARRSGTIVNPSS